MSLRRSVSGLVFTPSQFQQVACVLDCFKTLLGDASRTGFPVPESADSPSDEEIIFEPFSLPPTPEGEEMEVAESSASPAGSSTAPPAPIRRKRVLTVEEVQRKLLSGLQQHSVPSLESEAELFSRSAGMDEVCRKLQLLENQQNRGLIEQNFLIGGIIVEVIQHIINKKTSSEVSKELQNYSVTLGKTKVSEAKRVYSLCLEFPKLRHVTSGFSPMELTQALRHFKSICSSDRVFWSSLQ